MAKNKVKTVKLTNRNISSKSNNKNDELFIFVIRLLINTFVILLAAKLFNNIVVDGFFSAMLAALLISILNQFVKPYLTFLTIPLMIMTFGLFYPFINVIILKITSLFLGDHFQIIGIFVPIIISIFISFMNFILEKLILGKSGRNLQ